MKLTNLELRNSVPALQELMSVKLSPQNALRVAKTIRLVEDSLKAVAEAEKNIIKQVQEDSTVDGNKLLSELYSFEEDIATLEIGIEALGDSAITASTLLNLHWFIKE